MLDLEDRLREELLQTARGFEPSPDLRERIGDRIARRTSRRNQVLLAAAAAVVVIAAAGGVAAVSRDGNDARVRIGDHGEDPSPSTTTSAPPATTASTPTTTTSGPPPQGEAGDTGSPSGAPASPTIGAHTPLSRSGAGPIRAGMTIAQAEEAAGVRLVVEPEAWTSFGRTCGVFTIEGQPGAGEGGLVFVARTPGLVPSDDPRTAVIDAVGGSPTVEGIDRGATLDEVWAVYGQATGSGPDDLSDAPDSEVLLFEEGGYTYGFRIGRHQVVDIRSGHVTSLADFEPCQ
jgi:hypothetical protein